MSKKMLFIAAAAAAAAVLSGCAGAPGSVVNDPLAQRLIQAETKLQQSSGMSAVMEITSDGLPTGLCVAIDATAKLDRFYMILGADSRQDEACAPSGATTRSAWYDNGTLYVAKSSSYASRSCTKSAISHSISGEVAEQFVTQQTQQQQMADLMQAATDISGTDQRIELEFDVPTLVELSKKATGSSAASIPSDAEASAVITLTDAGVLDSMLLTFTIDSHSLNMHAHYRESTGDLEPLPQAECITEGSALSTLEQVQSAMS